jgi:hypothetical protein
MNRAHLRWIEHGLDERTMQSVEADSRLADKADKKMRWEIATL